MNATDDRPPEASDPPTEDPRPDGLRVARSLVIVNTGDALLIAHRDHSQDVGKIVKELGITGRTELI